MTGSHVHHFLSFDRYDVAVLNAFGFEQAARAGYWADKGTV